MFELGWMFVIALGLDLLLGDPRNAFHPVAWFGRLASQVEKLTREWLGGGIGAGAVGWLVLVGGSAVLAWLLAYWGGVIAAGIVLYVAIALRCLLEHARAIRRPLENGNLSKARRALSMIVSRDTRELPESEIIRGGIESVSENVIDAVNSALFWAAVGYCLGGIPGAAAGAAVLRAANTLDACWGYRNERFLYFGRVAARADDVLHWIPARLTALCIALASGSWKPLKTAWRHRLDHPSPNSCWGMAGYAGALNVRLGGPTIYGGEVEAYPYWGNGKTELTPSDLRRSERLTVRVVLLFAVLMWGITGLYTQLG